MTSARLSSLVSTYVHLRDDRSADTVEVTPTFWRELTTDQLPHLDRGRLVMQLDFQADWPTWERHPAGEEIVVLIAGEATLVLEHEHGEEVVTLRTPGEFVLVPRGVWHTARIATKAKMLFVTPGEGTENRLVDRG